MVGVAMTLKLDEPLPEVPEPQDVEVVDGGGGGGGSSGGGGDGKSQSHSAAASASTANAGPSAPSNSQVPVITIEDSVDGADDVEDDHKTVNEAPFKVTQTETGRKVDLMGGGDATSGLAKKPNGESIDALYIVNYSNRTFLFHGS